MNRSSTTGIYFCAYFNIDTKINVGLRCSPFQSTNYLLHLKWPENMQSNYLSSKKGVSQILSNIWCQVPIIYQDYDDVIMDTIASQITSLTIVYSTVHTGTDQRKHQSSASLAFVWEIHRWPVNFPHKWPVMRKMFPFHDVIMKSLPICTHLGNWLYRYACLACPVLFVTHKTYYCHFVTQRRYR